MADPKPAADRREALSEARTAMEELRDVFWRAVVEEARLAREPSPSRTTATHLQALAARALAACHVRGWATDWSRRGAYLFLECAEFIESLRGKGISSPEEEAADVLVVLLSMFGSFKIDIGEVLRLLDEKLEKIERGIVGGGPELPGLHAPLVKP